MMTEHYVGIDLGGTSIKAALANRNGEVQTRDSIDTMTHLGPEGVLQRIADLVQRLSSEASGKLRGIGLGAPGQVDPATGTTKFLPNFPTKWRDVPVASMLSDRFDCPVRLLNDVRTATLGELRMGHGKSRPGVTMAFFSIGTGIGGGVAIDGRLRLGPLGSAGELGHQTLRPDGPRCGCGNRGCLETLASGPAIAAEGVRLMRSGMAPRLHELVDGDVAKVSPAAMASAASEDQTVHEAIVKAATYIGIAAANVVTILHPDLVVLGGGVAEMGQLLVDQVQSVVSDRVGMFPTDNVAVERSLLGEHAGVLGAVVLATTGLDGTE